MAGFLQSATPRAASFWAGPDTEHTHHPAYTPSCAQTRTNVCTPTCSAAPIRHRTLFHFLRSSRAQLSGQVHYAYHIDPS